MYISSAPVEDLEIRICFEPDRFPLAMGYAESPIIENLNLSMQTVHIHIKLYVVITFCFTRGQFKHVSPQTCVFLLRRRYLYLNRPHCHVQCMLYNIKKINCDLHL